MWKIRRLRLVNFIHVLSGMQKTEIDLDLSDNDTRINILIGKMGSGKTSVLGHLQPFSTYGTLDVRNQSSLIIPNEDGIKEIIFQKGPSIYHIVHKYTWNNSSKNHSTKSFIKHNGVELNENGNIRSFKEIIRLEFGIDQNFLRLLRIGPNVSNIVKMKSTERKSFIASLLEETELYTSLYNNLSEEYRTKNTALNLISNKLSDLSSDKEKEYKDHEEYLRENLKIILEDIDTCKEVIITNKTNINSILGNLSLDEFRKSINTSLSYIEDREIVLLDKKSKIDKIPFIDKDKLSIDYGRINSELNSAIEEHILLSNEVESLEKEKNKLKETIRISEEDSQLENLKNTFTDIEGRYNSYKNRLNGFKCSYSYKFLTSFVNTINDFQLSLEYLASFDKDIIHKIYNSDGSIVSWAKNRMGMLTGKMINLKKSLQNIKFSEGYSLQYPLFRPPGCPTTNCPFIISHPEVIRMNSEDTRDIQIVELQNKIESVEKEILIHEEYIIQYPKMQLLKKSWSNISNTLSSIGALNESNLYILLTKLNKRVNWYDYDELIRVTELAKMQEDYQVVESTYLKCSNELLKFESNGLSNIKYKLETILIDIDNKVKRLSDLTDIKKDLTTERDIVLENISIVSDVDLIKRDIDNIENEISKLKDDVLSKNEDIVGINDLLSSIKIHEDKLNILSTKYRNTHDEHQKLYLRLQEIFSNKSSYNELLEERTIIKYMMEASSSKDGIPLVMVEHFLNECREIINDLIEDVFQDDLEILPFRISEETNEFKIPYLKNGKAIEDIESASQGEQAIITIALSFAIMRKSMFDYNIPLFDEVDNSVYKHDRDKFVNIIFKQMMALGTEQIFLITHNDIFQQTGLPINIIMTTNEMIDSNRNHNLIKL